MNGNGFTGEEAYFTVNAYFSFDPIFCRYQTHRLV